MWPRDGRIIRSASHRLAGAGEGGSGTDKYMDELDPVGWSIPIARGIVHPSQKVSALQWRRPVLWADYTSRSGVDYLLLLLLLTMGSHHLTRQLTSVLWDNSSNEKFY